MQDDRLAGISKAAFEGLLTIARNAVSGVDQQAAFIRDSMLFAEETLENTFDFAHKLVRMKEPQELSQIQTEFVRRQAQVLAGSGERIMQEVNGRIAGTASASPR
jgi:Phasin protein